MCLSWILTSDIFCDNEKGGIQLRDLLQDRNDLLDGLNLLVSDEHASIVKLDQLFFLRNFHPNFRLKGRARFERALKKTSLRDEVKCMPVVRDDTE